MLMSDDPHLPVAIFGPTDRCTLRPLVDPGTVHWRCAGTLAVARTSSSDNASSTFDLIPGAREVHVDGASARIGSLDYPLVRVFGHEFARDGIDAIVGRRHRDADAHRTAAGRLNCFGSRSSTSPRTGHPNRGKADVQAIRGLSGRNLRKRSAAQFKSELPAASVPRWCRYARLGFRFC
jgi:hypothetical protein